MCQHILMCHKFDQEWEDLSKNLMTYFSKFPCRNQVGKKNLKRVDDVKKMLETYVESVLKKRHMST